MGSKDKRDKEKHHRERKSHRRKHSPSPDHRRREDEPSPSKRNRREDLDGDDVEEGEVLDEPSTSKGGGGEISMSIEETNKLRAKLGLKPLEVGDQGNNDSSKEEEKSYEKRGEVFVKTQNISDIIETGKVKERIAAQKEKRKILEKLSRVKGLADSSDSEDDVRDTLSWVQKSRELDRKRAEQKAKELEEMEAEMERQQQEMIRKQHVYKDQHLKGLTVGHSVDAIQEGTSVVLTLKDKGVLDEEEEDVLENVNLVDDEKAADNVLNKKKGKGVYNPYDVDEDEFGNKNLLSKYDEALGGKKKETFKIGLTEDTDIKARLEELKKQEIAGKMKFSLEDSGVKAIASEFYTHEEMSKFKKPKKKSKKSTLRKREIEDDLVPLDVPSTSSSDLGSRNKNRSSDIESTNEPSSSFSSSSKPKPKVDLTKIKLEVNSPMDIDEEDSQPVEDVLVDDEAERELQEALEKARKLKEKEKTESTSSIEKIAQMVKIKREDEELEMSTLPSTSSSLVLDTTAEFCRNLGDLDSLPVVNRIKEEKMDFEEEDDDERSAEMIRRLREEKSHKKRDREATASTSKEAKRHGDWREVDLDAEEDEMQSSRKAERLRSSRSNSKRSTLQSQPILEEEPDVSVGVAAALKLAMNKGYLDKEVNKSAPLPKTGLEATNYTIEEKFYDHEERRGRGDRYAGPIQEFKDKDGYKPDVKLDYVDDHGRLMTPKEAFRVLSHKFHGKGPGKNKIDKRQQKLEQESKLRQMSSIDTPLNTVQKLQEKQKELQLPYVVISGTGTSLIKK